MLYLIFLPFHLWGLALLLGLSMLAAALLWPPDAAVTAAVTTAVTTAVVMISAEVSPEHDRGGCRYSGSPTHSSA